MKLKRVEINIIAGRCKGCGFCVEFCPKQVLRQSTEINSKGYHIACVGDKGECTGCSICDMICPDFAISVVSDQDSKVESEKKG